VFADQPLLVGQGEPRSQIIVSSDAPRMTRVAAIALQETLYKMTGALLPIRHERLSDLPLAVYVGDSEFAREQGVHVDELSLGAFRMLSGPDWLILAGDDTDFVPPEPSGKGASPEQREADHKAWTAVSGTVTVNPLHALWRGYNQDFTAASRQNADADPAKGPKVEVVGSWKFDRFGSLTAVHEFLERLGVRWYSPGDLGEVIPGQTSVALPEVDETIRPVYGLREFVFSPYFMAKPDDLWYSWRLRLNHGEETLGLSSPHQGHGGRLVHGRDETKKAHPEIYALRAGARMTDFKGMGMPSLVSPKLKEMTVAWARAAFDHFDLPAVSICPQDGFRVCDEAGPEVTTPERGVLGINSDYVWGFVNEVAREVYKTHPDKKIVAMAYGTYHLPPTKIEKLSPNVMVAFMTHRFSHNDPAAHEEFMKNFAAWEKIGTPGQIFRYPHYLHTLPGRGWDGIPVIAPRSIAKELALLPGRSLGDFIEVARSNNTGEMWQAPAINHLNYYVTSRLYWNLNLEEVLADYYANFYGPAAGPMRQALDFAEAHWEGMRDHRDKSLAVEFLHLLDTAKAAAPADSDYAKRIDGWIAETMPMRVFTQRDTSARAADLPNFRLHPITRTEGLTRRTLVDNETGQRPALETSVEIGWDDQTNELFLDIRAQEPDMASLRMAGSQEDDVSIWEGDVIDILIETQNHSYYQIAINPNGLVTDLFRTPGKGGAREFGWTSHAKVEKEKGGDYWRLKVRLPIVGDESVDHLNNIIGQKPSLMHPWHIQIGRTRLRGDTTQIFSFSPTGQKNNFHDVSKFGVLATKK
jgi:hypothetical protein